VLIFYGWVLSLVAVGAGAGWLMHRSLPTGARLWVDLLVGAVGGLAGPFTRIYFPDSPPLVGLWLPCCLGALILLLVFRLIRPPIRASRLAVLLLQSFLFACVMFGGVVLVAFPLALYRDGPPPIQGSPLVAELSFLVVTLGAGLLLWRVGRWPRKG